MTIAIIRIKGNAAINSRIEETLKRLNLNHKYNCIILENPTRVDLGMIKKVKDFVSYGEIDEDTLSKLKTARGYQGEKFFRLHPPRGGIDSKMQFGVKKGVLGDNGKDINKLIVRML